MSKTKSRLGKGLAGLISGTAPKREEKAPAPAAKVSDAKPAPAKAAPASATPSKSSPPPAPAAAPTPEKVGAPGFLEIPVGKVVANPYQPRRDFEESQLHDLAESIRSEGLIQPIVVREVDGAYQLIAGERRWRAYKLLKLAKIPARIIQAGDASSASMALIENLQRENLNPIEEALGYASLLRDFDLTQEQVAERVGKGRATIANALRLLGLSEEIRGYLATGLLSTGHAKLLLGIESKAEQSLLARRIIEEGVSVRGAEALIETLRRTGKARAAPGREVPAAEAMAIQDIEKRMTSYLNAKVALRHAPKKGKILIEYTGNDDLQRILEKIGLED